MISGVVRRSTNDVTIPMPRNSCKKVLTDNWRAAWDTIRMSNAPVKKAIIQTKLWLTK